jgi:hypothetical protein
MARPAPPDDTSAARLIATMVGIVGILLLGSLAWSAVAALFSALGQAASSLSPRPTPTRFPTAVVAAVVTPTLQPTEVVAPLSRTPNQAPIVEPAPTPTPAASGRAPWILLPSPAPGSHVPPGPLTVEARGRGDARISSIRLDMDGAALPVSLEQRGETTWRGFAEVRVATGQHAVRATVVDDQGRTGSYRWTFEAGP